MNIQKIEETDFVPSVFNITVNSETINKQEFINTDEFKELMKNERFNEANVNAVITFLYIKEDTNKFCEKLIDDMYDDYEQEHYWDLCKQKIVTFRSIKENSIYEIDIKSECGRFYTWTEFNPFEACVNDSIILDGRMLRPNKDYINKNVFNNDLFLNLIEDYAEDKKEEYKNAVLSALELD